MEAPEQNDFVRGYHLTSADHAISNISLRRLKIARLSEVNDPFELRGVNCMARNLRRGLDEFAKAQDKKIGMLSFSQGWKSPVLWSHYAAGHKGICLGFDIKRTLASKEFNRSSTTTASCNRLAIRATPAGFRTNFKTFSS